MFLLKEPFYHFRGCTQAQGLTYLVYFFTRLVSFKSHTPSACKAIGIMAILWWRSAPVSCRQLTSFLGSMSLIQKAVYIPVIMNNNLHMTYKPDPFIFCHTSTSQPSPCGRRKKVKVMVGKEYIPTLPQCQTVNHLVTKFHLVSSLHSRILLYKKLWFVLYT